MFILTKKKSALCSLMLIAGMMTFSHVVLAEESTLTIQRGNNPLTTEQARENKQQWDETQTLRRKINSRAEKEFAKADKAYDLRDACQQSANINAYWEVNTRRCLDRRNGHPVTP